MGNLKAYSSAVAVTAIGAISLIGNAAIGAWWGVLVSLVILGFGGAALVALRQDGSPEAQRRTRRVKMASAIGVVVLIIVSSLVRLLQI
ncbi:hypothetical protein [Cellulomonas soli]|uniref:Uncharacterized protein n=1 Tax=Cellulomonas soli TaxID=931535 RepID=A0A512PGI7_9CELL|nr:hypothetical protein [Cellulomonas soli]NYI58175.1 hypothetical protein [Cellulomonas soli]GEP70308.1 hypothetical protein CSO01_30230 [Cellulomonas soli]